MTRRQRTKSCRWYLWLDGSQSKTGCLLQRTQTQGGGTRKWGCSPAPTGQASINPLHTLQIFVVFLTRVQKFV